jgi:hypothetical protein
MTLAPTFTEPASGWWPRALERARARVRSAWRPHSLFLGGSNNDAAVPAFAAWCAEHEGAVCELALSSAMMLTSVMPEGLADADARQHTVSQWAHYNDINPGEFGQHWHLRELRLSSFGVLCAAPRPLIESLQATAQRHGVRLRWAGPWWARGVQTWLSTMAPVQNELGDESRELVLVEQGVLTHVQARQVASGPARLSLIWVEAAASTVALLPLPRKHQHVVQLLSAGEGGGAWVSAQNSVGFIWAGDHVQQVLAGNASTWQAAS